ncbi:MAG: hypothetical protein H0V29_09120 [Thermoleophilaceae bacterium]|nr:hypothetical protein [Thermoleophilaceae bacterium]
MLGVAVLAAAAGALVAVGPRVDGRSFGGFLAAKIACAATGGSCPSAGNADRLAAAYGESDAALVRRHLPGLVYERGTYALPVDPARCRAHACSDAPDDRDLDVHTSKDGTPATVFTRVTRHRGSTHIQYWLYYPDSNSVFPGSRRAWALLPGDPRYPGFHQDDWEGYFVRIDARGNVAVRASSHRGYRYCKQRRCEGMWGGETGWTRVSKGSHAGHIPLPRRRERTSTPAGLRLVPLETYDRSGYVPLDPGIRPPWRKRVWLNPEARDTG